MLNIHMIYSKYQSLLDRVVNVPSDLQYNIDTPDIVTYDHILTTQPSPTMGGPCS